MVHCLLYLRSIQMIATIVVGRIPLLPPNSALYITLNSTLFLYLLHPPSFALTPFPPCIT